MQPQAKEIQIIDHHRTYDNEKYTKYQFVKVKIKNDKGLCCATSLFYEYLIENNFLTKNNIIVIINDIPYPFNMFLTVSSIPLSV